LNESPLPPSSAVAPASVTIQDQLPPRRRRWRASNYAQRALACAVMAGWVLMPLMPVLALAFSWLNGLS
jgi:hypothetical protein